MRKVSTAATVAAFVIVPLTIGTAACGGTTPKHNDPMPTMTHSAAMPPSMPGMGMATGNGLADQANGYRFTPASTTLTAAGFRFTITGRDGAPVTAFQPDQTKLMHLYLVRSDLTGYQHVHPVMAADGTWTVSLAATPPGTYRAYASFIPKGGPTLVLSRQVTAPGSPSPQPLPTPAKTTTTDGYTLTFSGEPMAGMEHTLTVTITKNRKPATDLQPYLGTDAHLTAFHEGDMAFAHLHPQGNATGGRLSFHAMFAQAGNYRLFLQFQTGGKLHTAAVTLAVTG